jgi:hypothetical protein
MTRNISLFCQCRSLEATLDLPETGKNERSLTRLVCYCEDCQAYARYLGQADRVLGPFGGTDIVQLSPAWFHLKHGSENMACLRLSDKGILRWYASCCRTPICNTPSNPSMPYVGLISMNLATDRKRLDGLIGPVCFGVGAGKQHPIPAGWPVAKGFGVKAVVTALKNMSRWRLAGDHKRSELFETGSDQPITKPHVLTDEERTGLYR